MQHTLSVYIIHAALHAVQLESFWILFSFIQAVNLADDAYLLPMPISIHHKMHNINSQNINSMREMDSQLACNIIQVD